MATAPGAPGRMLVVDDEPSVRESVGYALEQEGFDVTLAADGEEAERKFSEEGPFDLLVLDIMMPGKSGLDVCREVRARSPVPIILLTAKDAEVDKVVGLEVGADDYVTKPFSVRELLGRVRAQLRRRELDRSTGAADATIRAGPVSIDLARHLVTVRGEPVNLTRSEFQVLRLLVEHPGRVFSRKEIMEELWQTEFRGDVRACDVHISNLRQKVEEDPQKPELVLTVRKVGYRFAASWRSDVDVVAAAPVARAADDRDRRRVAADRRPAKVDSPAGAEVLGVSAAQLRVQVLCGCRWRHLWLPFHI